METTEIIEALEYEAACAASEGFVRTETVAYAAAERIRELRDQLASLTVDYDNATRERAA